MKYGSWVWYDLNTTDVEGATRFYAEVVGWKTNPPGDGNRYLEFAMDGQYLGGITGLRDDADTMGAAAHWSGYVGVADVAATVEKARELGATILVDTTQMPGVGTFAALEDPTGAFFQIYQSARDASEWSGRPGDLHGSFLWHELQTSDPAAAFAFYGELFGWEKLSTIDMGEGRIYEVYGMDSESWGGVMQLTDALPKSAWTYYVTVDDLDAAIARVTANGGQVVMGPVDVPDGRIAHFIDPQGAACAFHAKA